MGTFFLAQGLVIKRYGEFWEFVARAGTELYFEQPETGRRETLCEDQFWDEFQIGKIKVVNAFSSPKQLLTETDAKNAFKNLGDFPKTHQEEIERRLFYINRLRQSGITIGQKRLMGIEIPRLAKERDDELGMPSVPTVCRWWRSYRQHHYDPVGLLSKNAERKHPVRLDEESEQFLQERIDQFYLVNTRPSVMHAFLRYQDQLTLENRKRQSQGQKKLSQVSLRTFYLRIDALPAYETMVARYGQEKARHHFHMTKGHLPANYPLDVVEIDHTPMNMYAIDDVLYLPLGRPWLTVIKDRKTGAVLGIYISFQQTGLETIFGVLKHSLYSHHRVAERWPDLINPWPCHGLGSSYVSDRGADFKSLQYRMAILSLGANYELCERRSPWLKGSVERFFRTLEQTFFESMPGRTFSCLKERGDYKPEKDAVVRFSTLVYLLHKWAVDYHNIMPNSRKQASPLELWNEGIGLVPPPHPANIDELNIILGLRRDAALSHEGLRFEGLTYANDELHDLMKWVGKGNRNEKLEFVVSPENIGHIHVKHPITRQYLKVECTRPDYANGMSLFQHKYLRAEGRYSLRQRLSVDALMDTRIHVAEVIANEIVRKENKSKSRLAKVAAINSNAVIDGESRSLSTPFMNMEEAPSRRGADVDEMPVTSIPHFSWGG